MLDKLLLSCVNSLFYSGLLRYERLEGKPPQFPEQMPSVFTYICVRFLYLIQVNMPYLEVKQVSKEETVKGKLKWRQLHSSELIGCAIKGGLVS